MGSGWSARTTTSTRALADAAGTSRSGGSRRVGAAAGAERVDRFRPPLTSSDVLSLGEARAVTLGRVRLLVLGAIVLSACGGREPSTPPAHTEAVEEEAAPEELAPRGTEPAREPEPEPEPAALAAPRASRADVAGACVVSGTARPVTVARGRLSPARVAVGQGGPMLAWLSEEVVHAMPIDAHGAPRGPEHDAGIPVSSDMNAPHWRDGGFWLEAAPGGFVIATHVSVTRRRWNVHLRALGPDGAPRGEPVVVETGRAQPDEYQVIASEHGLYVLYPEEARLERYSIGAGGLTRELLGRSEGARSAFAAIEGERHVTLVRRRDGAALRLASGAEVPVDFPDDALMLAAGIDGERVVFVYETVRGNRRPSWAVTVGMDGAVSEPISVLRGTPLPAPFTDAVVALTVSRLPPDATAPNEVETSVELRDAAGWRLTDPVDRYAEDVAWTGEHFLAVGGVLRAVEAFTLSCR